MSHHTRHKPPGRQPSHRLADSLASFQRDAFAPVRYGFIPKAIPRRLPFVEIDARHRADLLDLPRIHRDEGEGDQRNTWNVCATSKRTLLRLDLALRRPARCAFRILFDVDQCDGWLESVIETGWLFVVPRPVETVEDAGTCGIAWTLDTDPIGEALLIARLTSALRASR